MGTIVKESDLTNFNKHGILTEVDDCVKLTRRPKFRRVVVLGYPEVGKSSLTAQFVEGRFYQGTCFTV